VAEKSIKKIMVNARNLEENPYMGVSLSALYGIDTDYRYIFVDHKYLFYYIYRRQQGYNCRNV